MDYVWEATDSTIRGLAITGFSRTGIWLDGGSGNVIAANFIGLAPAGTSASGNATGGIWIWNSINNRIGGTTAAARNVISGNSGPGVEMGGIPRARRLKETTLAPMPPVCRR